MLRILGIGTKPKRVHPPQGPNGLPGAPSALMPQGSQNYIEGPKAAPDGAWDGLWGGNSERT